MVRIESVIINLDMHGKRSITITREEIPDFSDRTTVARLVSAIVDKEGGNVTGCHLHTMAKPMAKQRNGVDMTMGDYGVQTNSQLFAQLRLLGGAMAPAATTAAMELTDEGRVLDARRIRALRGVSTVTSGCDYYMSEGCGNTAVRCKIDCGGFTFCPDCMAKYLKQQITLTALTKPQLPDNGSTECESRPNCIHNLVRRDESGNTAMRYVAAMANLTPAEERQVASRLFANNQTVKVCPNASCGTFVYIEGNEYRVRCPQCRSHEWCFVCRQPWRNRSSQTLCGNDVCKNGLFMTLWNQLLLNTERENVSEIADVPTTRKCPNPQCFSMPIVRDSRCKHIRCEVCGEGFCLVCLRRKSVSGECPFYPRCSPHPIQNITSIRADGWTSG